MNQTLEALYHHLTIEYPDRPINLKHNPSRIVVHSKIDTITSHLRITIYPGTTTIVLETIIVPKNRSMADIATMALFEAIERPQTIIDLKDPNSIQTIHKHIAEI